MEAIHPHTVALIRKLESLAPLAPAEKAAIRHRPLRLQTVTVDQECSRPAISTVSRPLTIAASTLDRAEI